MKLLLALLFRCRHRHMSRPFTPSGRSAEHGTYVTCLDCGLKYSYSWQDMRQGKRLAEAAG